MLNLRYSYFFFFKSSCFNLYCNEQVYFQSNIKTVATLKITNWLLADKSNSLFYCITGLYICTDQKQDFVFSYRYLQLFIKRATDYCRSTVNCFMGFLWVGVRRSFTCTANALHRISGWRTGCDHHNPYSQFFRKSLQSDFTKPFNSAGNKSNDKPIHSFSRLHCS